MHKQPLTAPSAAKPFSADGDQDLRFQPTNVDRFQPTSVDHDILDQDPPDVRVMAMMLREALLGLGRVRSELADLRHQHALLVEYGDLVSGSTLCSGDTNAKVPASERDGFENAFDDTITCLADDMAYAPHAGSTHDFDWDEWERTTKARIRGSTNVGSVTTGATSAVAGIA